MEIMWKFILYFFLLFLLFQTGNSIKIQNGNDAEFENYLKNAMSNYSTWLKENDLDPSPRTSAKMTGFNIGVFLDCEISNHYMSGQSKADEENSMRASSNFSNHYFEMGRIIAKTPLDFYGEFVCMGNLSKLYYPFRDDFPFSGHGKFHFSANVSSETISMVNVGITPEHKLDLSHSWTQYTLLTAFRHLELEVTWNETQINEEYFADVEKGFEYTYYYHALKFDDRITFPAGLLLKRYVLEVAESVDLTEILDEEDLPDKYVPTPSPTTTTSTSITSTTTTTTEAPGAGQKNVAGLASLYAAILLSFILYVHV